MTDDESSDWKQGTIQYEGQAGPRRKISDEKIKVLEGRETIQYEKPIGPEPSKEILERRRDVKIQERTQQLKSAFGKAGSLLHKGAEAMSKMNQPPPKKKAIKKAYVVQAPKRGRGRRRQSRQQIVMVEEPQEPSRPAILDKIMGTPSYQGPEAYQQGDSYLDRLFGSGGSGGGGESQVDAHMRKIMGTGGKKKGKGGTGGLPYKL